MLPCKGSKTESSSSYILGFGFNAFGQVNGVVCEETQVLDCPCRVPVDDTESVLKISATWTTTFVMKKDGSLNVIGWIPGTDSMGVCDKLFPAKSITDVSSGLNRVGFVTSKGDCIIWSDYTAVDNKPDLVDSKGIISSVCVEDSFAAFKTDDGKVMHTRSKSKGSKEEVKMLFHPLETSCKVESFCCGKEHVVLLTHLGNVMTYGGGSRGQLGHGTPDNETEPRLVEALAGIYITKISTGGWHSAVISDSGDLYVWGWNESGQVGVSSSSEDSDVVTSDITQVPIQCQMDPVPLVLEFSDEENRVLSVSCGSRHSAAVSSGGQVFVWGWGGYGQLGLGDRNRRSKPTPVKLSLSADAGYLSMDVFCGQWNTFVVVRRKDTDSL